jgi:undecaprenyl-diphosphatase
VAFAAHLSNLRTSARRFIFLNISAEKFARQFACVKLVRMGIFESIVMGLVQGVTEFIPVSSSGHLVLTQTLFGQGADRIFIQTLDVGTLLALVIYFWPKIVDLCRSVSIKHDFRLLRNLVITALPVAVVGLALDKAIENSSFLNSPLSVSILLAAVGIVMIVLEKLPKKSPVKDGTHLNSKRALGIGLAQVAALAPGVSRSGSTIIAGRLGGLSPKSAAEYSFMVSIPVAGGLVLKLLWQNHSWIAANWQPVLIGNLAAFAAGMLAIRFLLNYLSHHNLKVFGWYRVGVGALFVILLLVGVL